MVDWYVVWLRAESERGGLPGLCSRRLGHILLFRRDLGVWLRVNGAYEGLEIGSIAEPDTVEFAEVLARHGGNWTHWCEVKVELATGKVRTPWAIGPLSCVELVKAVLGIGRFLIWTPAQLRRFLRDSGCVVTSAHGPVR